MLLALALFVQDHDDAIARVRALDDELRMLVRRAVRLGASGDPDDAVRARAALAALPDEHRLPEFKRTLLLGTESARTFVLSEVEAWRDRRLTRPVVVVALGGSRDARRTLRALADPETAEHLKPELEWPPSDLMLDRALDLAAEFGDARLTPLILPRLGPAVRTREQLDQDRSAVAMAASAELKAELDARIANLVAALRTCTGEDFGTDWRAWEEWARR